MRVCVRESIVSIYPRGDESRFETAAQMVPRTHRNRKRVCAVCSLCAPVCRCVVLHNPFVDEGLSYKNYRLIKSASFSLYTEYTRQYTREAAYIDFGGVRSGGVRIVCARSPARFSPVGVLLVHVFCCASVYRETRVSTSWMAAHCGYFSAAKRHKHTQYLSFGLCHWLSLLYVDVTAVLCRSLGGIFG